MEIAQHMQNLNDFVFNLIYFDWEYFPFAHLLFDSITTTTERRFKFIYSINQF